MDHEAPRSKRRLPPWLKVSLGGGKDRNDVRKVLRELGLHSVCEGANCPNLCECWRSGTATFMILGNSCTRNCAFCAVDHGQPQALDAGEPERVAEAAVRLALKHVVITSVTRDDLADGGAGHFAATIQAVKCRLPKATIEVLTPDFNGDEQALATVVAAAPDVFNHNIETCRRLTAKLRDRAEYDRSLHVLAWAASRAAGRMVVKSGFMIGVGETDGEIRETLADLRRAGVESLTIGQYLAPSEKHCPVERFVSPGEFAAWRRVALAEYAFATVASAPHVRSSYHAAAAAVK